MISQDGVNDQSNLTTIIYMLRESPQYLVTREGASLYRLCINLAKGTPVEEFFRMKDELGQKRISRNQNK